MITFVRGILVEKQPTRVVLDVGGIGYEILVPLNTFDRLPPLQSECRLVTYDHVREDIHQLYGFNQESERRMFLLLIDVTGIGPRTALSILSGLTVRELVRAIDEHDVRRLSQITGVGKKTAERLVLELKDRLPEADRMESRSATAGPDDDAVGRDAVMALIALGHKENTARKMVMDILAIQSGAPWTVEAIIKRALSGAKDKVAS